MGDYVRPVEGGGVLGVLRASFGGLFLGDRGTHVGGGDDAFRREVDNGKFKGAMFALSNFMGKRTRGMRVGRPLVQLEVRLSGLGVGGP